MASASSRFRIPIDSHRGSGHISFISHGPNPRSSVSKVSKVSTSPRAKFRHKTKVPRVGRLPCHTSNHNCYLILDAGTVYQDHTWGGLLIFLVGSLKWSAHATNIVNWPLREIEVIRWKASRPCTWLSFRGRKNELRPWSLRRMAIIP